MLNKGKIASITVGTVIFFTVLTLLMPTSCNIYEDLEPCPRGVSLRFVYDYNMEFANAFPARVDCYTLYVYDKDGNYLKTVTDKGPALKDEDYRMNIDLPHGEYEIAVYGGMGCEERSFDPVEEPAQGAAISDLQVRMRCVEGRSDRLLHDLFYGRMNVKVYDEMYRDTTVYLMRNTNNIRVLLQHLDGTSIPVDQFEFFIEDDNTLFDAENKLVPNGPVTYRPWTQGEALIRAADGEDGISAGYAEFSTSRLCVENDNRLTILRKEDNRSVVDIPLNQYLLLLKSIQYQQMDAQEFLDRENDWSMVFFLDSRYKWINTQIIVNGWTVRLNDTEL